jgi:uncharacterized membrane protein
MERKLSNMAPKQTSNLVVLTFEGQAAAEALYEQIEQMEKDKLVVIEDAVIIEREDVQQHNEMSSTPASNDPLVAPPVKKSAEQSIRVKQTHGNKGKYAAVGGGIGLLAATILGGPVVFAVVAVAGLGALTAALKDFGVNDDTISSIKQSLQPNTSALILLGRANDRDAFMAKLREFDAKVVMTSLDPEVEKELVARLQG